MWGRMGRSELLIYGSGQRHVCIIEARRYPRELLRRPHSSRLENRGWTIELPQSIPIDCRANLTTITTFVRGISHGRNETGWKAESNSSNRWPPSHSHDPHPGIIGPIATEVGLAKCGLEKLGVRAFMSVSLTRP